VKRSELKLIVMTLCLCILMMVGGFHERGYIAFDGGSVLTILLLVTIVTYYKQEEQNEKIYRTDVV
jgi:hypothetical protein